MRKRNSPRAPGGRIHGFVNRRSAVQPRPPAPEAEKTGIEAYQPARERLRQRLRDGGLSGNRIAYYLGRFDELVEAIETVRRRAVAEALSGPLATPDVRGAA